MTEGDAKFEEFVRKEAGAYNAPAGDVPREEMWAEIRRQRATGNRQREQKRVLQPLAWMGMAAMLIVGIAIGRFALRTSSTAVGPVTAQGDVAPVAGGPRVDGDPAVAYRRATTDHLARAEALLTTYSASRADATLDSHMTSWARDMLQNTRLLLDAQAPMDPQRRQLLRDLEAVLLQLSNPSPVPGPAGVTEDRAQVNRNLERTHMLTRLRLALPQERYGGT